MSKRIVDTVWEDIFEKYNVLEHLKENPVFPISADQIREFKEPRLVVKFDHSSQLPKIFVKNKITIMSNTRGTYLLGRFKVYEKVEYDAHIPSTKKTVPYRINTIDARRITSESAALHAAYVSGMIDDFNGEHTTPTVSGRMSSTEFDFVVDDATNNTYDFSVKNSQVEVDGGYESDNYFMIVEAKNQRIDDFHIRQMYYPFRLFTERNIGKKIRNVFFTYSSDIFSFFEFDFEDSNNFNSLKLVRQKHYVLSTEEITKRDIKNLINNTGIVYEPKNIPFPQADSFTRVIDMCHILYDNPMSTEDLATNYDFELRQADYYQNAGRYLNLISKEKIGSDIYFSLTAEGKRIVESSTRKKLLYYAEKILQHKVFKQIFEEHFIKSPNNFTKLSLTRAEIIEIMKNSDLTISGATIPRRASTVRAWLEWILQLETLLD